MKNSHITKTRNRLHQKAKILISDPKFQEEIKSLRKKWNISDGGFVSDDENQKWHDWIMESTDKFLDDNRSEESKLELEFVKHRDWKGKEKANQNFNNYVPINAFHLDLELLVSKYKLPTSWLEPIKRYLMFNNVELMGIPGNVMIVTGVGKHGTLMLEINADTTLEDIKFMWPMVMVEQKRLPDKSKKFQPAPMLDVDKRALELRNLGHKMAEISDIITKEFGLEVYTYKEASESVRRHKKRLGRLQA
jgi:hypothetical protein